jgi:hypothetical protein
MPSTEEREQKSGVPALDGEDFDDKTRAVRDRGGDVDPRCGGW